VTAVLHLTRAPSDGGGPPQRTPKMREVAALPGPRDPTSTRAVRLKLARAAIEPGEDRRWSGRTGSRRRRQAGCARAGKLGGERRIERGVAMRRWPSGRRQATRRSVLSSSPVTMTSRHEPKATDRMLDVAGTSRIRSTRLRRPAWARLGV